MSDNPVTPTNAPYAEIGISGVARYGSVSRVYEEFLRELQGPQGAKLYREAVDNDPIIGAVLFACQHLARSVRFRVEPAEGNNLDSVRAKKVAERLAGALFDDMDTSWPDLLSEILSMLPYGWAFHEVTFKRCLGMEAPVAYDRATNHMLPVDTLMPRELGVEDSFVPSKFDDGFIGWKSWGLRAQDTLFMWEWDKNSRATVMQQMAPPDYRVRRIPMKKGLLFRTQVAKQNPEGRSIIRNAMPSYLLRKNLQIVEAIGIERDLAGYPMFTTVEPDQVKGIMPPDLWNTNDPAMVQQLATIQKIVKAVRRDEQEGLVLPWWLKFSLVTSGGSRSFDTSTIISRYDRNIAISVIADFVMLGHEAVGSKALAQVKSQLFTTALSSFIDNICAIIDRFAFPQILKLNGIPQEYCPKLKHGDVEHVPLEILGAYIGSLSKAGMQMFPSIDGDLEKALLQAARLPATGLPDANEGAAKEGVAFSMPGEMPLDFQNAPQPEGENPTPFEEKKNGQ